MQIKSPMHNIDYQGGKNYTTLVEINNIMLYY